MLRRPTEMHIIQRKVLKMDIDEVYPGVLISSMSASKDIHVLIDNNVTHIIQIGKSMTPKYDEHFEYMMLDVDPRDAEGISKFFSEAAIFIDQCILYKGIVLVACMNGMSASAALVVAYLMIYHKLRYFECVALIRKKRFVLPCQGLREELFKLEESIFGDCERDLCF